MIEGQDGVTRRGSDGASPYRSYRTYMLVLKNPG